MMRADRACPVIGRIFGRGDPYQSLLRIHAGTASIEPKGREIPIGKDVEEQADLQD